MGLNGDMQKYRFKGRNPKLLLNNNSENIILSKQKTKEFPILDEYVTLGRAKAS